MPWEKAFDVDAALEKAGDTFWSNGYKATSMRDLLDAMGIQKGSFYDTYGSKKEAYLRALEQYIETRAVAPGARAGQTPRQALELHLEQVFKECIGPDGHRGCMVVNCALELAHSDATVGKVVRRALQDHENFILQYIVAAQQMGDVSSSVDAAATAKAIFGIVIAMRVHARAGTSTATLRTLVEQASALLDR